MGFFDILPWWSWAVGTLGVAGVVALAIFAPALAGVLLKGLLHISEEILKTRLGLAAAVGLAAALGGYFTGAIYVEHKCEARIEQMKADAEEARLARDTGIRDELERTYGPVVADLKTRADKLQQQVADHERRTAKDARCQLGPGPLRLRQRKPGPGGPARR